MGYEILMKCILEIQDSLLKVIQFKEKELRYEILWAQPWHKRLGSLHDISYILIIQVIYKNETFANHSTD